MKPFLSCFYCCLLLALSCITLQRCLLWTPEKIPYIISFSPSGASFGSIVTVKGLEFIAGSPEQYIVSIGGTGIPVDSIKVPDSETMLIHVLKGTKNGNISISLKTAPDYPSVSKDNFIYYYTVTPLPDTILAGVPDQTDCPTCLFSPKGMDVDNDGNLFVADYDHQVIQKITPSTRNMVLFAGQLNHSGAGNYPFDGQGATFANPSDLAIDQNGEVYVADRGNNMIRKIGVSNHPVTTFSGKDSIPGGRDTSPILCARFNEPVGICADNHGIMYVVEYSGHRLRKLDIPADRVTTLAGDGNPGSSPQLSYPTGVDCLPNETPSGYEVYVADFASNFVRAFDIDDVNNIRDVKVPSLSPPPFSLPFDVSLDSNGNFFVTNQGSKKVQIVYSDKTLQPIEGFPFESPCGIVFDEKHKVLYVSDDLLHIIVQFKVE